MSSPAKLLKMTLFIIWTNNMSLCYATIKYYLGPVQGYISLQLFNPYCAHHKSYLTHGEGFTPESLVYLELSKSRVGWIAHMVIPRTLIPGFLSAEGFESGES